MNFFETVVDIFTPERERMGISEIPQLPEEEIKITELPKGEKNGLS